MQSRVGRSGPELPLDSLEGQLDEPLGGQLKAYFDGLALGPVPDKLLRLTEALELAFERGELSTSCRKGPRS